MPWLALALITLVALLAPLLAPHDPFLRVAELNPFVARIGVDDDTSVLADFAEWLRGLTLTVPAAP